MVAGEHPLLGLAAKEAFGWALSKDTAKRANDIRASFLSKALSGEYKSLKQLYSYIDGYIFNTVALIMTIKWIILKVT